MGLVLQGLTNKEMEKIFVQWEYDQTACFPALCEIGGSQQVEAVLHVMQNTGVVWLRPQNRFPHCLQMVFALYQEAAPGFF